MKLDNWQKEVLETEGSIVMRSGRQVGKSTVIGIKAAKFALDNPNKLIMVISRTERQAELLFSKILFNLSQMARNQIKTGVDRPRKSKITLHNKSTILCLPTGDTGFGIMGFTIDLLIADEAAFIPEEVWNSIIPALAITRGNIWLLSTPYIKEGYYWQCFSDDSFTQFHTSSEDCPRRDDAFLAHKKETLTKSQYAQMYLGRFVDDLLQLFPDELIKKCCTLKRENKRDGYEHYFGCDVARMDKDEFTYEILEKSKRMLKHVENITTKDVPIPESTRRIMELNKAWKFKKEYIDSGGMGITVCDILREDDDNKRLVVEINNASRPYDRDDHQKKVLKEDLYHNLKGLMEKGKIQLLDDDDVKLSLKSINGEHNKNTGRLKIWGNYSHITEGLIRAAWCIKDKSLNIWIEFS